jgi:hypothetical protein
MYAEWYNNLHHMIYASRSRKQLLFNEITDLSDISQTSLFSKIVMRFRPENQEV